MRAVCAPNLRGEQRGPRVERLTRRPPGGQSQMYSAGTDPPASRPRRTGGLRPFNRRSARSPFLERTKIVDGSTLARSKQSWQDLQDRVSLWFNRDLCPKGGEPIPIPNASTIDETKLFFEAKASALPSIKQFTTINGMKIASCSNKKGM